MTSRSQDSFRRPSKQGWTLVELMIAVVIIGLLASLAMPAFARVTRNAQSTRIASDIRVFSSAFQAYNMQNGDWPATTPASVVPTGMPPDFKAQVWESSTAVGGVWRWVAEGGVSGIHLVGVTVSDAQMAMLDRGLDDGDLSGGHFRQTGAGEFIYELR